jgi:hypothetical protein
VCGTTVTENLAFNKSREISFQKNHVLWFSAIHKTYAKKFKKDVVSLGTNIIGPT